MATEGPSISTSRASRYRVAAVDSEHTIRTKLAIELAAVGAVPYDSVDAALEAFEAEEPAVIVLGPSHANDTGLATVQRVTRTHPTCGVILLVDELSLDILQHALDLEPEPAGIKYAVSLLTPTFSPALRLPLTEPGTASAAAIRVAVAALARLPLHQTSFAS